MKNEQKAKLVLCELFLFELQLLNHTDLFKAQREHKEDLFGDQPNRTFLPR